VGWTIALALIVLIAQLGAQTHAYTHLTSTPDSTAHHTHPAPCVQCSTFAPLLTAVNSASYAAVVAVLDQSSVCSRLTVVVQGTAVGRAYRSRAPPIQS
jgi:hypothetical protein